MFFDFYVTLWVIISPKKHILVKIRLEKVDLGEVYIQKEQENFKKRSSSILRYIGIGPFEQNV